MHSLNNKVHLIGNLGRAPELSQLENGKAYAKTALATNITYNNRQGEKIVETQWHRLVAFDKTAQLMARLLKKGNMVVILGKLQNRTYQDQKGNKHQITEVLVNDFMVVNKPVVAEDNEEQQDWTDQQQAKAS